MIITATSLNFIIYLFALLFALLFACFFRFVFLKISLDFVSFFFFLSDDMLF